MMIRDSDEKFWENFLILERLADKGLNLGHAPVVYLLEIMWG